MRTRRPPAATARPVGRVTVATAQPFTDGRLQQVGGLRELIRPDQRQVQRCAGFMRAGHTDVAHSTDDVGGVGRGDDELNAFVAIVESTKGCCAVPWILPLVSFVVRFHWTERVAMSLIDRMRARFLGTNDDPDTGRRGRRRPEGRRIRAGPGRLSRGRDRHPRRAARDHAAWSIANDGLAAYHNDDVDTAIRHLREAIARARRCGSTQLAAQARMTLAFVQTSRGRSGPGCGTSSRR